jgi:hypothetical protein
MARDEDSHTGVQSGGALSIFNQLGELITDALRYWELRRLFYNALLAAIVLAHFAASWPASKIAVTSDGVLGLFILAVIANLAYSVVYLADIFIQFSGFRASRTRWRWVLLGVGFAFAAVITHFVAGGITPGNR